MGKQFLIPELKNLEEKPSESKTFQSSLYSPYRGVPCTRLTEAWGVCKAQWNCKFPGRSTTIGRIQTGTKDAENSWFSKQQYGFMQTTKAQWNCKFLGRRCRKLMILQAAVRLCANNVRVVTSRKKYRKCNVPWEMQQTHDAAFISTHLRNQRSAEIRRKPMKPSAAVPHIYVALRFCKKGKKV